LIVGAGPGGLTAAIALRRVGIEAALFERATALGRVGQGLGVQSNALRALMRLGVGDRVYRAGTELREQQVHNGRGRLVFRLPQGEIADAIGAPTVGVLRSELQFALVDALDDGVLRLASRCTGVERDADGVTAHFADGRSERGALLIGADGGRSVVRRHVYGDAEAPLVYSGITIWRSVLENAAGVLPPGTSKYFNGPGMQFVLFPVGLQRVYWGLAKAEPEGGQDPPGATRHHLCELLQDFPELTRRVVQSTAEADILRSDLYDRDPVRVWVKGRVALLGDAAHLTTPFIGQGAGVSIEDSVVLAKELALTDGLRDQSMLDVALESYQRQRVPRCEYVVKMSRRLGQSYMMSNPISAFVRDAVLGHLPDRSRRAMIARNIDYEV
jgi:2-polyprenyl-6-methoxyphenol hydroxylase-like FAD-dependent oxidoreductase